MALDRAEIKASLLRKGFVEEPGDHDYFRLVVHGRRTSIYTKLSRGTKYRTLGDDLVTAMARQVKLRKAEFVNMVDCSISGHQYLTMLREQGVEL